MRIVLYKWGIMGPCAAGWYPVCDQPEDLKSIRSLKSMTALQTVFVAYLDKNMLELEHPHEPPMGLQ